jgi:spermidine synthase
MSISTLPYIDLSWFNKAEPLATPVQSSTQHDYQVLEYDQLRWISNTHGAVQSMLFTDDPSYPVLHYVKALLCSLLFVDQPERVLNLGLGSGAIERYIGSHHPDISVTSVEPIADMISLSRECFFLDSNHPVRNESAEHFLQTTQQKFDLIICDIDAPQDWKNPIESDTFLQYLKHALLPQSLVAINFLAESESHIVNMLVRLRKVFKQVTLFDVSKQQNIVLYCSNANLLEQTKLQLKASLPQFRHLQAESIIQQLIWLPE